MKKATKDIEKFFAENNDIIMKQSYFEKYRDELSIDNTRNLMVEEYIKNIKSVLTQARNIAEKSENEFNKFKNDINSKSKRTKLEDVEIDFSNNKNQN